MPDPNSNESKWISHHQLDGELAPIRKALNDINDTLILMKQIHKINEDQFVLVEKSLKASANLVRTMHEAIFVRTPKETKP